MIVRAILLAVVLSLLWSQRANCQLHSSQEWRPVIDPSKLAPVNYNSSCECGRLSDNVDTRIVGGSEVTPHRFPWLVAIMYKSKLHCGGTLVSDLYVLTAAHCVSRNIDRALLELFPGMHNVLTLDDNTATKWEIESYTVYEGYNTDCFHDIGDIALIRLKAATPFSDQISPVCLPEPGSEYDNITGIVTGWGHTEQDGNKSSRLRQTSVRIIPQEECMDSVLGEHITDTMMCTYTAGKDACQGDSGGPLLYEDEAEITEQIGIVSWGIGCAKPGTPGVYTKLTDYLTWIQYHTQDSTYCTRR